MFQIAPILADNLNPVIANLVPIIAQNLASKNSEIQDLASSILDVFIEYLGGCLMMLIKFNESRLKLVVIIRWRTTHSAAHKHSGAWQCANKTADRVQAGRPHNACVCAQTEASRVACVAGCVGAVEHGEGQQWQRLDGLIHQAGAEFARTNGRAVYRAGRQ